MTNKDLAQRKKELKITAKTLSKLNPDKTLSDIICDKVYHVIKSEVESPPYIAWISKRQILYGGKCFNNSTDSNVKTGLLWHTRVSQPTNEYLRYVLKRYGYTLEWPPEELEAMIQSTIRKKFINPYGLGEEHTHLEFLWGKGYIDSKTEKFKVEYPRAISGYFIYMADEEYRPMQQEFINTYPEAWMRYQYWHNQKGFIPMVNSQIERNQISIAINQGLLDHEGYKAITVDNIDESLIEYNDCESEDKNEDEESKAA